MTKKQVIVRLCKIINVRENKKFTTNLPQKGANMKAFKIYGVEYRSRSAAAVVMAKRTKKSNSEIARLVGMTPQTVKQAVDRAAGRE